jgi:putative heme iron utilization protein
MVPFALLPGGPGFVVLVSQLAAHTRDMVENSRVSLMVVAAETPGTPPQALARVTVQGRAEQWPASDPRHSSARDAYLARFPQAVDLLQLPDFSFFVIRPVSIRLVAGFAQALTLAPEALASALESD